MTELFSELSRLYNLFCGKGKLVAFFLVAVIVIIYMVKSGRSRVHPLLFVLSVWSAIAFAFTKLIQSGKDRKMKVLAAVFLCFAIVMSGTCVWSGDNLTTIEKKDAHREDIDSICKRLLSDNDYPHVLASADDMPYFTSYSNNIQPLYHVPQDGDTDAMEEDERALYADFSDIHLSFSKVNRICHNEDNVYVVVDSTSMWPIDDPYENGYVLYDMVNTYAIYKYTGGAYE